MLYKSLITHQFSNMDHGSSTTMIIFPMLLIFIFLTQLTKAQDQQQDPTASNFQPSLFVVIGVLSFMFFLTFILLMYAKFCHRQPSAIHSLDHHHRHHDHHPEEGMFSTNTRFSGLDKTVVESLPFFKFSSLRGSKQGLQCSVCLAEFGDSEILRLLPKCKHGFHIECIDKWLESHSTCPLCRQKVSAEDLANYTVTTNFESSSVLLDLSLEREEENNIGGSFRRILKLESEKRVLHRINHRIVISDVVFMNRWSNVSSSDLMFLNSEMLEVMSTENDDHYRIIKRCNSDSSSKMNTGFDDSRRFNWRFSRTGRLISADKRAMSEITAVTRFKDLTTVKNKIRQWKENNTNDDDNDNDDVMEEIKRRKIWFPIARRTVKWFVNRERNKNRFQKQQSQNTEQSLDV